MFSLETPGVTTAPGGRGPGGGGGRGMSEAVRLSLQPHTPGPAIVSNNVQS